MRCLLEASDLTAGYTTPVVGPVSFCVGEGEIVGLTGPNGAGKSTVLGAVTGTARIFGGAIRRAGGIRVAVQAQRPVRLTEMPVTGREFLALTGASTGRLPSRLEPLLPARLDRLSGGQFQLLAVWACLGSPADLVLLDEPTNNMDPTVVDSLAELLVGFHERRGVLIVSHEADFLSRIGARIVEVGR